MNLNYNEFDAVSKEQWLSLLEKELKGKSIDETLIKKNEIEELTLPSFIHKDDYKDQIQFPGVYPYKRGFFSENLNSIHPNDWSIVSKIKVSDETEANKKAISHLEHGASGIYYEIDKEVVNLALLFKDINVKFIPVYIASTSQTAKEIVNYFKDTKTLLLSIICNDQLQSSSHRTINLRGDLVQASGANIAQELAFVLHQANLNIEKGLHTGQKIDDILVQMNVNLGIGANFLFEIAKFRAFRMIWSKFVRAYEPAHRCNETVPITAHTTSLNKSLKDPYTNLLRQTTEVMSAALGGANHIVNQAYDYDSKEKADDFSERMSLNIALLLKEESYMHHVIDGIGGSYLIEILTNELAKKSWEIFQKLSVHNEIIPPFFKEEINKIKAKRLATFENKQQTLIGINQFENTFKIQEKTWKEESLNEIGLQNLIIEKSLIHA